jgi:hypothetical protein
MLDKAKQYPGMVMLSEAMHHPWIVMLSGAKHLHKREKKQTLPCGILRNRFAQGDKLYLLY